jgi:hypothetical protein
MHHLKAASMEGDTRGAQGREGGQKRKNLFSAWMNTGRATELPCYDDALLTQLATMSYPHKHQSVGQDMDIFSMSSIRNTIVLSIGPDLGDTGIVLNRHQGARMASPGRCQGLFAWMFLTLGLRSTRFPQSFLTSSAV